MSQAGILFRARWLAIQNATRGGALTRWVALPTLVAVGAVVLGHLAAPSLLDVPADVATPDLGGRAPVRGTAALEAAFWLNALLVAFFAFRVMESLFRSETTRAIELLPVRPSAILAERTVNALAEGLALGTAAGLFFLPLAWHGAGLLALLCFGLSVAATTATAAVTIGTNTWFGANYGASHGVGDAYGGHGGAFIYAPAVSFALAVVCLFLFQLGVREVLHDGRITNAFWLSTGVSAALAVATLLVGAGHFVRSYHRVVAFFREADEIGYRAVMEYQSSIWEPVVTERLIRGAGAFVVRRHVLQFGRAFPVARSIAAIGAAGGAIAALTLTVDAFPTWAVALVPAVLVAVIERPFARLDAEPLGGEGDALLAISPFALERSRFVWSVWEVGRIALPYALVAGAARAYRLDLSTGAWTACAAAAAAFGVVGLVSIIRRAGARRPGAATAVSVGSCAAMGALLVWSLVAGVVAATVTGTIGLVVQRRGATP